jgi:hypothetical protein
MGDIFCAGEFGSSLCRNFDFRARLRIGASFGFSALPLNYRSGLTYWLLDSAVWADYTQHFSCVFS